MLHEKLRHKRLILASGSPRRQQLLKELGLTFDVRVPHVRETYPRHLNKQEIAIYLSELKANFFDEKEIGEHGILIAADTIVWMNNQVLPKPSDENEAVEILNRLSGNAHDVITGVTIRTASRSFSFFSDTRVFFKVLTNDEIQYYINTFKPFDKAGGYGIQEWIGKIGITKIEGSYYNVMGLPVAKLYSELDAFLDQPD
jgi:septum formation protein